MKRAVIALFVLMLVALAPPALAGGYRDYNPSLELLNQSNDYGYVNFIVHGVPYSSPVIYIIKGMQNATSINITQEANFKSTILPDGSALPIKLPAGNWTGYVMSGVNLLDSETRQFKTGNAATEWVVFDGEIRPTSSGGCS